jgi:hypothetical protein
MTTRLITLALMLAALTACQSVPAERKNNCSCNWEILADLSNGGTT